MNKYEIMVSIEDAIYDSSILDDYDTFIWNCIAFTKERIIPLSANQKHLNNKLQYCVDFMEGNLGKTELNIQCRLFTHELSAQDPHAKETKIHAFLYWLLDYDFLNNIAPDEQQDRTISYVISDMYDIHNDLEFGKNFTTLLNNTDPKITVTAKGGLR